MEKEHKQFLELLRRTGHTNMYGAAPYLVSHFGMNIKEARTILSEWMKTYNPNDKDYADL